MIRNILKFNPGQKLKSMNTTQKPNSFREGVKIVTKNVLFPRS